VRIAVFAVPAAYGAWAQLSFVSAAATSPMDERSWRLIWRDRKQPPAASEHPNFEDVVIPNLDAAYSLARWLVRDPALAEDVVQDSVARGLSYFASFRGGDAKAWLMRIVRNTAYTAISARQKRSSQQLADSASYETAALTAPDPALDPEQTLLLKERTRQLEAALARLPTELRECLILKEVEELSYKEIAQVIGIPIGTVMSRLWRARQALMHLVKAGEGHD
jgi:RNA polymerase sigma factor (sigma-70 family)